MPRKGRGGARQGQPGKAYGQRSDLNGSKPAIAEYRGQAYGQRKEQVDAQRAVPVAPAPTDSVPGASGTAAPLQSGPAPGTLGDLLGASVRPNEPLTAGLPTGPGPGPEVLARTNADVQAVDRLRALYAQTGSPSLGRLLEAWDE